MRPRKKQQPRRKDPARPRTPARRPSTLASRKRISPKKQLSCQAQLLDVVHDAIIATDLDGRITCWNPAAERAFGWKAEEVLGRTSHPAILSELTPKPRAEYQRRMIEDGKTEIAETVARKDGTRIRVEGTAMPVRAPNGRVIGCVGAYRDVTERHRAQATIQELSTGLERKYSTILETTRSGFWLVDTEGQLLEVNAAYAQMSGYSQAELLNMYISDLEANESQADSLQHILLIRKQGHHEFESRHRRKDGTIFDVEVRVTYLDIERGQLVVFIWDISERKRAEKALRESEARFRALAEALPQVVWSADASGAMDYYNPQAYAYAGVAPGDIHGWNWATIIHPDDLQATIAAWRRVLETGATYKIEHRLRRADGQFRWHLTRCVAVREEQGCIVRWIGTATDVQDQKQAEEEIRRLNKTLKGRARDLQLANEELEAANEELRMANEKLQKEMAERQRTEDLRQANTLINTIIHSTLDFDEIMEQTVILAARAIGCETAAISLRKGDRWIVSHVHGLPREIIGTEMNDAEERHAVLAIETKKPVAISDTLNDERVNRGHLQKWGVRSVLVAPLIAKDKAIGVLFFNYHQAPFVFQDLQVDFASKLAASLSLALENARLFENLEKELAGRKRFEEDTQRLNQNLERRNAELAIANRELEAFSYSISHDLRAPLASIEGFSRLMLQEQGAQMTPDGHRYLGLIRENASAMTRLIEDLLAFSRTSRQPLKRQAVSPVSLVRQVLEELRGAQIGRHIEITVGDLPPCQADPTLLKQVFVNLISNALKFTRKREVACIELGWGERDGEPAYYVKDNGVGFDMNQAERLFSVFQRLHPEEEYEGTGVGLAIVERIIRRHEGRVWAEAEVDKGATFYFTLPAG